jgi:exopolysaccharide biosynthesis polyprenyl glycosylphosphotransferase
MHLLEKDTAFSRRFLRPERVLRLQASSSESTAYQKASVCKRELDTAKNERQNPNILSLHVLALALKFSAIVVIVGAGLFSAWACHLLSDTSRTEDEKIVVGTSVAIATSCFLLSQISKENKPPFLATSFSLKEIWPASGVGYLSAGLVWLPLRAQIVTLLAWSSAWIAFIAVGGFCVHLATTWARAALMSSGARYRVAIVDGANDVDGAPALDFINGPDTTYVGLFRCNSAASCVEGTMCELRQLSQQHKVDGIVLIRPIAVSDSIQKLKAAFRDTNVDLFVSLDSIDGNLSSKSPEGGREWPPLVKIGGAPLAVGQVLQQAIVHWIIAAILVIVLMPLLCLIAIAIKLDSPGPILFVQPRRGYNNRPFKIWKFRTMYHHLQDLHADQQTSRNDPRITRVGRALRKLSLDELPQLFNVLKGEMSTVGPRPHAFNTKACGKQFSDIVPDYFLRYRIKPGITGLAQISDCRGAAIKREDIQKRVFYDLKYIDSWSIGLDLKILVLTLYKLTTSRAF